MDAANDKELKLLSDLRVCDLKVELEKRNLDTTGNKTVLVERLSAELERLGKDPKTFNFNETSDESTEETSSGKEKDIQEESESVDIKEEPKNIETENSEIKEENENNELENCDNNDESMILTIEEDEQKLMHEEAQDSSDLKKKEDESFDAKHEENGTENPKNENEETAENSSNTNAKETDESSSHSLKPKASTSSRNLWISGLSTITRASDLKLIFSKYGKVVGAKVVTNTRTPGTRCYGYITMSSSSEATRCIQHLHCTELHGRIISVERTKNEVGNPTNSNFRKQTENRKSEEKSLKSPAKSTDTDQTKDVSVTKENGDKISVSAEKPKEQKSPAKDETADKKRGQPQERKNQTTSGSKKSSNSRSSRSSSIRNRSRSNQRKDKHEQKSSNVLSYESIREERERQRLRERERALREEERRRIEIRRRQREEEQRLIREREKLAIEREKIEKEKAELLRMERERQKLEREKIELEKLELKRQQKSLRLINDTRIDESKRMKRIADERFADTSSVDRKRRLERSDRRIEAPPPPRFDSSIDASYEKKRESLNSKRNDFNNPMLKSSDDYISMKRDYGNLNKRDDYSKRDVDSSLNRHSNYNRDDKQNRYDQSAYRSNRGTIDDSRNANITNKRYDMPDHYERNSINSANNWQHSHGLSSSGHGVSSMHSGSTLNPIKSFVGNGMQTSVGGSLNWSNKMSDDGHWVRGSDNTQDRYDRTYNERSANSSYMGAGNRNNAYDMIGSNNARSMQDRFGNSLQRYDSSKY